MQWPGKRGRPAAGDARVLVRTPAGDFRVDMLTELHRCILVCECDESDHATYSIASEGARMRAVAAELTRSYGKPVRLL